MRFVAVCILALFLAAPATAQRPSQHAVFLPVTVEMTGCLVYANGAIACIGDAPTPTEIN